MNETTQAVPDKERMSEDQEPKYSYLQMRRFIIDSAKKIVDNEAAISEEQRHLPTFDEETYKKFDKELTAIGGLISATKPNERNRIAQAIYELSIML